MARTGSGAERDSTAVHLGGQAAPRGTDGLFVGAKSVLLLNVELEQAVTAGSWPGIQIALLTQKNEPRKFSDKLADIDVLADGLDASIAELLTLARRGRRARRVRRGTPPAG